MLKWVRSNKAIVFVGMFDRPSICVCVFCLHTESPYKLNLKVFLQKKCKTISFSLSKVFSEVSLYSRPTEPVPTRIPTSGYPIGIFKFRFGIEAKLVFLVGFGNVSNWHILFGILASDVRYVLVTINIILIFFVIAFSVQTCTFT